MSVRTVSTDGRRWTAKPFGSTLSPMTEHELAQFLEEYRQAMEAGIDETPEWRVLVTVTMEDCATPEEHDALIKGIDVVILTYFSKLADR